MKYLFYLEELHACYNHAGKKCNYAQFGQAGTIFKWVVSREYVGMDAFKRRKQRWKSKLCFGMEFESLPGRTVGRACCI